MRKKVKLPNAIDNLFKILNLLYNQLLFYHACNSQAEEKYFPVYTKYTFIPAILFW